MSGKKGPLIFVGLDGEMTGTTKKGEGQASEKYQLIQIGLSVEAVGMPNATFVSDIGYASWNETKEAMEVNKFTAERIRAGPSGLKVDAEALTWLESKLGSGIRDLHAVGWNVGSFDLPFVQKYLPNLGDRFSYRSVDLNSVVYAIVGPEGTFEEYDGLKAKAKQYAEKELGEARWHDAGYDAAASLLAFRFLCEYARGKRDAESERLRNALREIEDYAMSAHLGTS